MLCIFEGKRYGEDAQQVCYAPQAKRYGAGSLRNERSVRLNDIFSSSFHVLHGASLHLRCNISPYVTTRIGASNFRCEKTTEGLMQMHVMRCMSHGFFASSPHRATHVSLAQVYT